MTSQTTTDHDKIRSWTEERDGRPARVKGTGEGGVLRLDFGDEDEGLETIDWDAWFEIFEDSRLALLYQEKTSDGQTSRFNKLVSRDEN